MAKDIAIVLNKGNINSAVVTALASQRYRPVMLHVEAPQSQGTRLRAAYDLQVAHFKPYREHALQMPYLQAIPGTSAAPTADPRRPAALVPKMLDLLPFISGAVRYAVHYQAAAIYLGVRVGPQDDDLHSLTEYLQIWNELLQVPCGQSELELLAPLLELEPHQVIDLGFQVGAPFERTWSCVEDSMDACWACRSCRAREAAFQQAGKQDPLRGIKKA